MKKEAVIAALVVFSLFPPGVATAALSADGRMTIDKGAAVWPANRLKGDKTKKRPPVTFNHGKHGDRLGCAVCHHQEKGLKAGDTEAKPCFGCHGPKAVDGRIDTYEMIHGKKGACLACHRTDTTAQAAKAPTACEGCHVEPR